MIEPPPRTSHAAFHRRIGASDTRSGTQQWKQPDTLVEWGNNPDFWKDELPPNSKSLYIPFNGAKSGTAVSNSIKKMINDFELEGVKAEIGTSEDKAGGKVIPGMEILGPIFVSEKSKPDVIVTLPNNLVPLLFEVQSHAYEESIYQTASYLLDNFRLLRNLIQWKEWSAYLFPKPNEEGCVTRVDVTWIDEDLKFLLTYEPLSLDEYREDIRKKLNEQVEDVKQVGLTEKDWKLKLHCGIPLSEASLQHLAEVLKCGSWIDYEEKKSCEPSAQRHKPNEEDEADSVVKVEQWPSLSSIIVASNGHMYKHIIDPEERSKMAKFVNKGRDSDLCLLPIDFVDLTLSLSFLKYPVLDFPMTKAEVRKCFFHFAKGVSVALSCLHRRRHVAHLDVRLENVAFRRNRLNRGNVFFSSIDSYSKIKLFQMNMKRY